MAFSVSSSYERLRTVLDATPGDALPSPAALTAAADSLPASLPYNGLGEEATTTHLLQDVAPGFNGPKTSANYYGFVTGGVLPIAEVADNIVTAFDQNVQVHLPDQSVSTVVEDRALTMLIELLSIGSPDQWLGRTFTTGATGANILGLACGREAIITKRLERVGEHQGVGELGLLRACAKAGITEIQVLTSIGHSSLYKAASIVGLGRASVKTIPGANPWEIDLQALEQKLKLAESGCVSIVAISAGEVNTGKFATDGLKTMQEIRKLCDEYGAWLHVDGAFGLFARTLPDTPEFSALRTAASGLELADSITGDGHKMLNVPYDCGFFLTRLGGILPQTFQNPNAAYLSAGPSSIPSPLNIGLENSRRFRALPIYAVLVSYGLVGLQEMFVRQVRLARSIASFLYGHGAYEVLATDGKDFEDTHIVVLFRAKDQTTNAELVKRINGTRKIYVSGTAWDGKPAVRFAVSTWKVDVERDLELVKKVLEDVVRC
ncbi:PLP-dependent transferase-2 [Coleophoma crateriformis]|uniref:PLP-dependent transferase-2 n=1 Tax=Coleophoma crateriformis TaxID=565419 RepID=A0A3D8T0W1_9HELO|nr:PLP-dependent transferase-2 [Coleophoma crateriformis]